MAIGFTADGVLPVRAVAKSHGLSYDESRRRYDCSECDWFFGDRDLLTMSLSPFEVSLSKFLMKDHEFFQKKTARFP